MKGKAIVKLKKAELGYLINYLLEEIHAWSEKGIKDEDEIREFERITKVVNKLRAAIGDTGIIIL